MSEDWRHNHRVTRVLDEADLLSVAVAASNGPHVTPTVFDIDAGRLWFVTPRRSVKAKVIARRRRVGGLVQLGRWSVVIGGRARIVDPLTARGIFSVGGLLDLPFAAAGYLSRNHRHATGTIRDHQAPALALSRVLVSVDIRRLAFLDGWTMVDHWGRWDGAGRLLQGDTPAGTAPDLSRVPPGVRNLLGDGSPTVLGWQSPAGPLALPAEWRADTGELATSAEMMELAGATSDSLASVCAERSRYRLNSKQGLLMTGAGHARRADGAAAHVSLEVSRTTWWKGEERHTTAAGCP